MAAIDYILQHQDFQSTAELRNPASIKAVADLTASKLVLTDASKNLVSSSLGAADLVTASSTTTFTNKTIDANGTGNSISNLEVADFASGVIDTDLSSVSASDDTLPSAKATKAYVDAQVATVTPVNSYQDDILAVQTDNTLDPGATPTTGDRYILTNVASLHTNFGTITGVGDDDIVEYNGSAFTVVWDASAEAAGVLSYNRDDNHYWQYTGSAWQDRDALFTYTASSGITKSGNNFQIDANAITNSMLAGSIADSKLSQITTANKVAGSAVQLTSTGGLEDSSGLKIKPDVTTGATVVPVAIGSNGAGITVDNLTLENNSGTARVKSSAITATQLASDAVTTAKILNSNVTFAKLAADAKPYAATFADTDFSSQVLTVSAATHGLGTSVTAKFEMSDGGTGFVGVSPSYAIDSSGNITLEVVSGLEFNGRITVSKRA